MKHMIRRIIVGIIIGLILMCCRKYLFMNVSAMSTQQVYFDTYRFTNQSTNNYSQVNFNNLNANLPSTTLGSTNAGNLTYFFHVTNQTTLSPGQILYISMGTSLMFNDGNDTDDIFNTTFSSGTNGYLVGSNNSNAFCEVSTIIGELDSLVTYRPTKETTSNNAVYSPYQFIQQIENSDFRYVTTYKCYIDEELVLGTGTNTNKFVGPNLMYGYAPWGFYNRGYSQIMVYSSMEDLIISSQEATTSAVEDVNDTLTDSSTDDPSSDLEDMQDYVPSNGTISQLLTLPITLYQNILNSVNGSCSSFQLGSLLGTNLSLPCINLQNILGSTLYGVIDILCSGLFILSFRKKMVDIFNHMTSLNDRGNELE